MKSGPRELSPGLGEIAVGARQFDSWIRYYAVQEFLGVLRLGSSVSEARDTARREVRYAIETHNHKRPGDIHWHRAHDHVDKHIYWLAKRIAVATQGESVVD